MILLNDDQKKALEEWIVYALSNLNIELKRVELLIKYILKLIKFDSTPEKIKNSLHDFLNEKTDGFVDELQERLEKKDFSFKKESPPPPPAKAAPPPKQQEPAQKVQPQSSTKQTASEIKKEAKTSSKTTENPSKKNEIPSKSKPQQSQPKAQEQIKPQQKNQQQQQKQPPQHQKPQQSYQPQQHPPPHHQKPPLENSIFDEEDLINDDDDEPQSDETVEKVQEEKIESKNLEPSPRYIIFIAGIDRNNSSILTLFGIFTKYGRILAIEVDEDEKVAYIEFEELLSAFKAIKAHNKKNLFKNSFVQVDYAIIPDPEKLANLETEYNKRKQQRQEKKQQMLQQQLEQQKKESEAQMNANEEILEEEDQINKDIIQRIKDTKELIKNCTDPAQMEELKNKLATYETLFSDL